ncbi:probable 28S ribosomal protein S16, mitochondrial isoform X1 [Solenopsis invicta]|uniref:probable 28S ribosomal protein S16, mitochondrial isoform X1 n=1 Tax=Solenopsis invicta TaxID=13686 RepID=UPI00193D852D|nr:probable 28S ribosomal protein S16, mitochondrial isoform X1 [Solenopsis invicta]
MVYCASGYLFHLSSYIMVTCFTFLLTSWFNGRNDLSVMRRVMVKLTQRKPPIEQVGVYDPLPNVYNEKLVSFNYERIQYWLARRAQVSKPVADLLGLAGYLPVHPRTYMRAWRNRKAVKEGITKDNVHQEEAIVSTN